MNCERCLRAEEAQYRAYSDIIDMKVCAACAADGRKLRLSIEVLDPLHSSLPRQRRRRDAYQSWSADILDC